MQNGLLVVFLVLASFFCGQAQPGALDHSFDPGSGGNNATRAIAEQSDHKILIGGVFTVYNGSIANRIARLLPNGTLDTSFHTNGGANSPIRAIAIQSDGRIIIGGDFTSYGGITQDFIARLNIDGTVDTTFHCALALNASVHTIAIQTDGRVIIGGAFSTFNGASFNHLARLNTDGTIDNGFNVGSGANGDIECLAIQPDGKIFIGGSFTFYNSNPCLRIGRVNANGSPDTGFNTLVGGASSTVWTIALEANSRVLIGGDFTNYNANSINHVVRIGSNGSVDGTFNVGAGANSTVSAIKIDRDSNIVIVGNFTSYNSTPVNRVIVVDQLGALVPHFNPGRGGDNEIFTAAIQHDNKILIGGILSYYDSVSRNNVARLYNCTTSQPGAIAGSHTTPCSGGTEVYTINAVVGADSYEWTLPQGWSGRSDSTSIIATTNGTGGVISVRAYSELCGYSAVQTDTITLISPPDMPICMVTVDTQSSHNIIIWEKPHTTLIDSFCIYREITTGVYSRIATIPYDSFSEYHDYAADPNVTSYKYKLTVLDHCGVESVRSYFHNTIHLQNLGGGNLQWTFYQIENTANPVVSFNVYRDDLGNGNFAQIGLVPGTNATFTDINSSFFPNCIYVVDVAWGIACSPSRAVNTTRSNIRHKSLIDTTHIGLTEVADENWLLYPNPAFDVVHVSVPASLKVKHIEILNCLGQTVFERAISMDETESTVAIDLRSFAKGVYTVQTESDTRKVVQKLVVQ